MPLWLLLLVLLVLLAFLIVGFGARTEGARRTSAAVEDDAELADAEREVGELDASVTPEEADDHFADWGPGAPKPGP